MDNATCTVLATATASETGELPGSGESGASGSGLDFWINPLSIAVWTSFIAWALPKVVGNHRFSTPVPYSADPDTNEPALKPKAPFAYRIQIRLILFVISLNTIQSFVMQISSATGLQLIAWISCYFLVQYETQHKFANAKPKYFHHKFLQAFWTTSFVFETVWTVTAVLDEHFATTSAHFGLLITRLIVCELVLLLGLYAPGFPALVKKDANGNVTQPEDDDDSSSDDDSDSDEDDNSGGSAQPKLKKFVSKLPLREKVKLLRPFLWPTNSRARMLVFISLATLGLDRFLVIYENLFSKKIVDSLDFKLGSNSTMADDGHGDGSLFHVEFRWDFVVYSALIQSVKQLTKLVRETLQLKTQNLISSGMQVQLFEKLHALSLRWHLERRTGSILRKLQAPFGYTSNILEYFITEICTSWTDMIISLFYISQAYNERVTWLLVITVICSVGVNLAFHTWDRQYEAWIRQLEAAKLDKAVDSIINFETVKYFSNEAYETTRFKTACEAQQAMQMKKEAAQQYLYALRKTVQNFGLLGVQLGCLWMVLRSQGMSPGDYVFLTAALYQFANPLSGVLWTFKYMMTSLDELEELQEVLDLQPEIGNAPAAANLVLESGDIELRNVNFHYTEDKQILHDVSFKVKGGETLAIVGESGSGKSTIIKLLFRFYDATSGQIVIDGQDIKGVTQNSLRKAIGVVPQDTVLFNDTIANNIKYGNLEHSKMDDVIRSARHACIHDRIKTFKDGYQTQVAERGLKLSGGEKQRIAIARMLLKNPKIFLLDEATSALDTHTEQDIRQSLTNACKNRTSIIIAHRLSTVVHADNIIVLREGRIAESGRHEELMKVGGIYAKMWQQQIQTMETGKN